MTPRAGGAAPAAASARPPLTASPRGSRPHPRPHPGPAALRPSGGHRAPVPPLRGPLRGSGPGGARAGPAGGERARSCPRPLGAPRRGAGMLGAGGAAGAFALLLLPLLLPRAARGVAVCGLCPGPPRNGSIVARFCESRRDTESDGRCCRERGPTPGRLLGLDLSNCSLHSVPPGLAEATTAIVLDLTENPLTTLPSGSFLGFIHLQSLAVPLALQCPGGSDAWQDVTADRSSRLCQGQRNACNSSVGLAWPCPENSVCAPDGPGLIQCLCASPFHGYKCLREDTFPMLLFGGILGTATVSLSLLLWGTQRRKAKTP
ncbi:all-trans retinoic acid-induced differentiation factor isoform X2 [Vidua chalybeata]|uniref:all-trans retinoic acid-induced differentiation factor isoform X2 n=1 Tax=Vidua chalybeata TaxID=81927 RepID=UPI0023A8A5AF|nr:all-trans retinoic acid-induced differentiation factor isoform X2 [Vidua chalybeata]